MNRCSEKVLANRGVYTVFYSSWCGFSKRALEELRKRDLPYKGYEIDNIDGKLTRLLDDLTTSQELTGYNPNHTTRPIIFYDKKFLGGCDELINSLAEGEEEPIDQRLELR